MIHSDTESVVPIHEKSHVVLLYESGPVAERAVSPIFVARDVRRVL